jgi:hypothetical protein
MGGSRHRPKVSVSALPYQRYRIGIIETKKVIDNRTEHRLICL